MSGLNVCTAGLIRVASLDVLKHGPPTTTGRPFVAVGAVADRPQCAVWSADGRFLLIGTQRHAVLYDVRLTVSMQRPPIDLMVACATFSALRAARSMPTGPSCGGAHCRSKSGR